MSQAGTEPGHALASGEPPLAPGSSFEGDSVNVLFSWAKQAGRRAAATAAEALLLPLSCLPPGLWETGMMGKGVWVTQVSMVPSADWNSSGTSVHSRSSQPEGSMRGGKGRHCLALPCWTPAVWSLPQEQ